MIFFTADTHFAHANIIKYCNRPFSDVNEMNEVMLKNWNETVGQEDTVYHLGDLGFKLDYIPKLNGNIILIRGNHDRGFSDTKLKNAGIKEIHKKPTAIDYGKISIMLMHAPKERFLDRADLTFCGHVHDAWKFRNGIINVGVDVWNFKPVSIIELLNC